MKPISIYFKWIARKSGGIFLGFRCVFPMYVQYTDEKVYKTIFMSLGFIFFSIDIELRGSEAPSGYWRMLFE